MADNGNNMTSFGGLDESNECNTWKIQTDHDPPLVVLLPVSACLSTPLMLASQQFQEGKTRNITFETTAICPHRPPWMTLFRHLKDKKIQKDHGLVNFVQMDQKTLNVVQKDHDLVNLVHVDVNFFEDTITVYDYFTSGDGTNPLMTELIAQMRFIIDDEKHDLLSVEQLTIEGLIQMVNTASTLKYPSMSEMINQILRLPSNPSKAKLFYEWGKTLHAACVANPLHPFLGTCLVVHGDRLNQLSSMGVTGWTQSQCFVSSQPAEPLDSFMKQYCEFWDLIQLWLKTSNASAAEVSSSFSSVRCMWTGGSLAMAHLQQPFDPTMDIDFWVFDPKVLTDVLAMLWSRFEPFMYFLVHKSVLTIYFDQTCPLKSIPLQFICSSPKVTPVEILKGFDIDYLRAYSDGTTMYQMAECSWAMLSRTIHYASSTVSTYRINKAVARGFQVDCPLTPGYSNKTMDDYFHPNCELFSKEYNANMLRRLFPTWKVTTTLDEVNDALPLLPFELNVRDETRPYNSAYQPASTLPTISVTNFKSNVLSLLKAARWSSRDIGRNRLSFFTLSHCVEFRLDNVMIPAGIVKGSSNSDRDRDCGRGRGRDYLELGDLLPEFCNFIHEFEALMHGQLRTLYTIPPTKETHMHSLVKEGKFKHLRTRTSPNMKILNGQTMRPYDQKDGEDSLKNCDFQNTSASVVLQVTNGWFKENSFGLIARIKTLIVYPRDHKYNKHHWVGINFSE